MTTPTDPVALTADLVRVPSITPEDQGCQDLLTERLKALGFTVHDLTYGKVRNFYARLGSAAPLICLAGHTDVVPTGPADLWTSDPFTPEIRDGHLYGRGTADMKSALAAMVCATERYLSEVPAPSGSIAFLITGDEEGDAIDGTRRMMGWLEQHGELPDFCLVGEPSSIKALGDTIKNGRRGSINGELTIHGAQGHVAYPERAANPIHLAAPALADLAAHEFDGGDGNFPPTRLQMTGVQTGVWASNVIPGALELRFNLRFSPQSTPESIDTEVREVLARHGLNFDLEWHLSGLPFLTPGGALTSALGEAVRAVTGRTPELSTVGGTSDARFIAPHGVAVAELGLINATIHKVDECASVADIHALTDIYQDILKRLLG